MLANKGSYEECQGQPLKIGCTYRDTVHQSDVTLTTGDQDLPLTPDSSWRFALFEDGLIYTVPAEDATGTTSYSCNARSVGVSVTIHFGTSSTYSVCVVPCPIRYVCGGGRFSYSVKFPEHLLGIILACIENSLSTLCVF